jgi:hypothetical protein
LDVFEIIMDGPIPDEGVLVLGDKLAQSWRQSESQYLGHQLGEAVKSLGDAAPTFFGSKTISALFSLAMFRLSALANVWIAAISFVLITCHDAL